MAKENDNGLWGIIGIIIVVKLVIIFFPVVVVGSVLYIVYKIGQSSSKNLPDNTTRNDNSFQKHQYTKNSTDEDHVQNETNYIHRQFDKNGNNISNWLFRHGNYPYQFSLKCAECPDILYTSAKSGKLICKNGHNSVFDIHESLFSSRFEIIEGNQKYVTQVSLETIFEILGCLAKSDGRVCEEEIEYSLILMKKFINVETDRIYVKSLQDAFRKGKQQVSYNDLAILYKYIFRNDQNMYIYLIDLMIEYSFIDGHLDDSEKVIIRNFAKTFENIPLQKLEDIFNQYDQQKSHTHNSFRLSLDDCFVILESNLNDNQETVKKNYFRLAKKYHPDQYTSDENEKLIAENKLKQINLAWEEIKKYFNKKLAA